MTNEVRLPPGPAAKYTSTEDLFTWMNENLYTFGDIYKAIIFGSNVYVVSNPVYCEHILRWNWRNYTRSGQIVKRISLLLGKGLIGSNGEFWASQRRMIQPAFTKTSIGGMIPLIISANADLLEKWKMAAVRHESVNVTFGLSCMVLRITLVSIFGDDYPIIAQHFEIFSENSERNLDIAQPVRLLKELIVRIAAERRRDGKVAKDFLGILMEARDRDKGQPMPDAQLANEVMTLVIAGHETTASILNWIWWLLSKYPEVQTKLSVELDRLPWGQLIAMETLPKYIHTRQVIDEALRLYPPLWLMTRRAINDDRLGDYFVPAGTEIYISPYLIQRSPELWEAPDLFDPERMDPDIALRRHELALCPFGAGPRNCIGELFARIEIQIHLMMFARELRLRCEHDGRPEVTTGINLLSKHDFIMLPELNSRTTQ